MAYHFSGDIRHVFNPRGQPWEAKLVKFPQVSLLKIFPHPGEPWKRAPGCLGEIGDEILPSYVGITS